MKNTININQPTTALKLLIVIFFTLSITPEVGCNKECLVDQCKMCLSKVKYECEECESGYYLRTFYGKIKKSNYNDCWS